MTHRIALLVAALTLSLASSATASPPGATTGEATGVTDTAATLNGTANPNKEESTFYFEYGTTTGYGAKTPVQNAGGGNAGKAVSAAISGLTPSTTYHFRLVVTNASGTDTGADKTFTTLGAGAAPPPAGTTVSLAATPGIVTFGRAVAFSGQVGGSNAAGTQVELESTPFPFSEPFKKLLGPVAADAAGKYSFTLTPQLTTRYRATAKRGPGASSTVVEVRVRMAVGLSVSDSTPRRGQRVRFFGAVKPAHHGRTLLIQRRTSSGRYRTIARTTLRVSPTGGQSAYSRRLRVTRSGVFRARVSGDGDHLAGTSRARRLRAH